MTTKWIAPLLLVLAVAGCSEATAEVNAPTAWDTRAADPRFADRAARALATALTPEPGWRTGVIMAETDESRWAISVLTPDGPVYVTYAWNSACDVDDAYDLFPLLLDPGDLITWAGDGRVKHNVCAEDMRVLRKGAA